MLRAADRLLTLCFPIGSDTRSIVFARVLMILVSIPCTASRYSFRVATFAWKENLEVIFSRMKTGGLKEIFGRSLALREDQPAGTRIEPHHLALKKPAGGIPSADRDQVVGRVLVRDTSARRLLRTDDLA